MTMPLGVYRPGTTWLHRAPVGAKILGLIALSILIVARRDLTTAIVGLGIALAIGAFARVDLRSTVRSLRAVFIIATFAALLQWWLNSLPRAVETLIDLVALALLALSLSATTSTTAMTDAIIRWLGPFRRFGIDPDRIALTIGLAIGFLPTAMMLAAETRDAARARGLRTPRAWLTPFVIRVVAHAQEIGAALSARGVGDD